MTTIQRQATGIETLEIADCPCCGGGITIGDCGYSSFNPGFAQCTGECKRKWKFANVDDQWDAGNQWNSMARQIRFQTHAFTMLAVDSGLYKGNTFTIHVLKLQAKIMLDYLEKLIIGAEQPTTLQSKIGK